MSTIRATGIKRVSIISPITNARTSVRSTSQRSLPPCGRPTGRSVSEHHSPQPFPGGPINQLKARSSRDSMSDAQEMHERTRKHEPKRCFQCHRQFGLIRQRFALKLFCSKTCVGKYRADTAHTMSQLNRWTNFLNRKL